MIYVNGCSYCSTQGKNFGNYLSKMYEQSLFHKGIPGSSNNRIFRTTTRDLLKFKNKKVSDVKVVIGLTFLHRSELWIENHGQKKWTQFEFDDGEFVSYQFHDIPGDIPKLYKKYCTEWIKVNHIDSLMINTIYQASLLKNLCENLGYKLVIFWAADNGDGFSSTDPEMDSIKEFAKEFNESNSIDLFNFSFTKHYFDLGYKPYDFDLWKEWGHPCTDVHNLFAHKLYEIFEGQKYNV